MEQSTTAMLVAADVVKKFSAFNEKWRSVTFVTTARDWSILSASGIQSACSYTVTIRNIFRRVSARREERPLVLSYPSKYLSACNNAAPTGRIFVKFDNGGFQWKSVREIEIWLKSVKKYRGIYMTTLILSYCWQRYEIFVLRQECNGNPLKHFQCNTQQFHIVDSYM